MNHFLHNVNGVIHFGGTHFSFVKLDPGCVRQF